MKPRWKLIGLAGLAGVAATGVIIARKRRAPMEYGPDELRERLHSRLAGASTSDTPSPDAAIRFGESAQSGESD